MRFGHGDQNKEKREKKERNMTILGDFDLYQKL